MCRMKLHRPMCKHDMLVTKISEDLATSMFIVEMILKMEAADSSETLITFCQTVMPHPRTHCSSVTTKFLITLAC